MTSVATRVVPLAAAVAAVLALVLTSAPAPAAGTPAVERAQRRLDDRGCSAGPVDGRLGGWTRSAVLRFQSRSGLAQSGRLTRATRTHLYAASAKRCDRRPVPARSGA